MSRTDLDAVTLANSLRMKAGDGSIEWVSEPIQASVLLDIADMLDENAKLRELLQDYHRYEHEDCYSCRYVNECRADESGRCIAPMRLGERYRELGIEVDV